MADTSPAAGGPPPLIRAFARASSLLLARAPWLWPLFRRPTMRFWQRAAAGWDQRVSADQATRVAPLIAACDQLAQPPRRVLELGTGTGIGALALARRFPEASVTGVDLSPAMVERAREKLTPELQDRVRFEVADAADLPFEDDWFELVCQLNMPIFAREAARVLAPGGQIAIASSFGPQTPYYTPDQLVRRQLGHAGLGGFAAGEAGSGTYLLAKRPQSG